MKPLRLLFLLLAGCGNMLCPAFPATLAPRGFSDRVVVTKITCSNQAEAYARARAYAAANGGSVGLTSGTPSMEPLIHGQTFTVIQDRPYNLIKKYDLLVYMGRPNASKPDRLEMLHRAVKGDRYGWIMSGDNNRWSESWDRVTPKTYLGTVVALFECPDAAATPIPAAVETARVTPR